MKITCQVKLEGQENEIDMLVTDEKTNPQWRTLELDGKEYSFIAKEFARFCRLYLASIEGEDV